MKLLFIHGFGLTTQIWKYATEYLKEIPISILDLPGYPYSDVENYETFEQYTSWLNDSIAEPTVLVCHSMAGYIALESLKYKNKNICGLALVHSHPFADSESKKVQRQKTAEFINNNGTRLFVKSFIPNLFYDQKNNEINEQITYSENINSLSLSSNSVAMSNRFDHSLSLENIAVPISFILGKHDRLFNYQDLLKFGLLASVVQINIFSKSAHMAMLEEPKIFYDEVVLFYKICIGLA